MICSAASWSGPKCVAGERVDFHWWNLLPGGIGSLGTAIDPEQVAAMLLAMEDGFRLHRLIDPSGTPPDSFMQSLRLLQRALNGGVPEGLRGR
jgi:hypothetical protein